MEKQYINLKNYLECDYRYNSIEIQTRAKSGKWITVEKHYSQFGYTNDDIVKKYLFLSENNTLKNYRILNGIKKQIISNGVISLYKKLSDDWEGFWKVLSVRDISGAFLCTDNGLLDITVKENIKKFVKFYQDMSDKHGGIKSYKRVPYSCKDDLEWGKLRFNDGTIITLAFYY